MKAGPRRMATHVRKVLAHGRAAQVSQADANGLMNVGGYRLISGEVLGLAAAARNSEKRASAGLFEVGGTGLEPVTPSL
jgi:hypothetical protein